MASCLTHRWESNGVGAVCPHCVSESAPAMTPLKLPSARTKPTFDEWHTAKFGASFDVLHMNPTQQIHIGLRRLTERLREYVSDMVL